jgi:hypothetical protein
MFFDAMMGDMLWLLMKRMMRERREDSFKASFGVSLVCNVERIGGGGRMER